MYLCVLFDLDGRGCHGEVEDFIVILVSGRSGAGREGVTLGLDLWRRISCVDAIVVVGREGG